MSRLLTLLLFEVSGRPTPREYIRTELSFNGGFNGEDDQEYPNRVDAFVEQDAQPADAATDAQAAADAAQGAAAATLAANSASASVDSAAAVASGTVTPGTAVARPAEADADQASSTGSPSTDADAQNPGPVNVDDASITKGNEQDPNDPVGADTPLYNAMPDTLIRSTQVSKPTVLTKDDKGDLSTYCLLREDETFLCPNDKQKEKIKDHILKRSMIRGYTSAIALGFVLMAQLLQWVFTGWVGKGSGVNVYDTMLKQMTLLMSLFVIYQVLSYFKVIEEINTLVFSKLPERLNLDSRRVGDIREGLVVPELGTIIDDVLILLGVLIPLYGLMVMMLSYSINSTISKWRNWEVSGFHEKFLLESEDADVSGTASHAKLLYMLIRRGFTTPGKIYPRYTTIENFLTEPKRQFLLFMYFRGCLRELLTDVIRFPIFGIAVLIVSIISFVMLSQSFPDTVTILLFCAIFQMILWITLNYQKGKVQTVLWSMPPQKQYLQWILNEESNGTNLNRHYPPAKCVPPWKISEKFVASRPNFCNWVWYGTMSPTRQEMLWTNCKRGPGVSMFITRTFLFIAYINLGVCVAQYAAGGIPCYKDNWCNGFLGFTVLLSLHAFYSVVPNFLLYWVQAARTDSMTDVKMLSQEVHNMALVHGEASDQELLFSIYLHLFFRNLMRRPEALMKELLAKAKRIFEPKEIALIEAEFYKCAGNPYAGLEKEEVKKALRGLGQELPGSSVFKWSQMMGIRQKGFLSLEEFKCLLTLRSEASQGVLKKEDYSVVALRLADVGKTGAVADRISQKRLGEVFESTGVHKDLALVMSELAINKVNQLAGSNETEREGATQASFALKDLFSIPGLKKDEKIVTGGAKGILEEDNAIIKSTDDCHVDDFVAYLMVAQQARDL